MKTTHSVSLISLREWFFTEYNLQSDSQIKKFSIRFSNDLLKRRDLRVETAQH